TRRYGQRWQVETVFSMIKRRLGETLSARSYHRQNRALLLKAVVHNILILLWPRRFSTEHVGRSSSYRQSRHTQIAEELSTSIAWAGSRCASSCRISVRMSRSWGLVAQRLMVVMASAPRADLISRTLTQQRDCRSMRLSYRPVA
ncbi:MAG: transposase, partial [Planctomycetes bacterium]|nr:transposase [Planctomycetota bacterium]